MKINIVRKSHSSFAKLEWEGADLRVIESRVLKLKADQLAALLFLVGIKYSKTDIEGVVSEILRHGHNSVNIGTLLEEADSRSNLLWWISFFERHNTA